MTKSETEMTLVLRKRGRGWVASVGEVADLQGWHAEPGYENEVEFGLSGEWADNIISDGKIMRHIVYKTPYAALLAALKRLPGGKCKECDGEGLTYEPVKIDPDGSGTYRRIPCTACTALLAAARRELEPE